MNTYTCPHGLTFEHFCHHTRDGKEVKKRSRSLEEVVATDKSDCCHAFVRIEGEDRIGSTRWFVCTACNKPCNVAKTEELQHKEIDMTQKYTQSIKQYWDLQEKLEDMGDNDEISLEEILQFFTPVAGKEIKILKLAENDTNTLRDKLNELIDAWNS